MHRPRLKRHPHPLFIAWEIDVFLLLLSAIFKKLERLFGVTNGRYLSLSALKEKSSFRPLS